LINDLKELCLFYVRREDISVNMPEPSLDVNAEYEADSRNKNSMSFNS